MLHLEPFSGPGGHWSDKWKWVYSFLC